MKLNMWSDVAGVGLGVVGTEQHGTGIEADAEEWQVPCIVIKTEARTVLPVSVGRVEVGCAEGGAEAGLRVRGDGRNEEAYKQGNVGEEASRDCGKAVRERFLFE